MVELLNIFEGPQRKAVVLGLLLVLIGFLYEYKLDIKSADIKQPTVKVVESVPITKSETKHTEQGGSTIASQSEKNNVIANQGIKLTTNTKYIANKSANITGITDIGITVVDGSSDLSSEMIIGLSNYFNGQGLSAKQNIFTSNFITNGVFNSLYNGELNLINDLNLTLYCDKIILGYVSYSFKPSTVDQTMTVANATLSLKIISTSLQTIEKSISINAISTGWSQNEAKQNANREIISQFKKYI